MLRIIADDKIPFLKGVLEPYADIIYLPGKEINREIAYDADALIIRTRTKCNEALLQGTKVRFIATATIGFDHINTSYCDSRNIHWVNAPGCNSSSVQQYITSALLTISKKFDFQLKDKTLGIVGVGNVGSKVEKIGRLLGMNVLLNDPPRARKEGSDKFIGLQKLLNESDIVTFHVPLNRDGIDKTFHLVDDGIIDQMKKGAWLFNSSRGEVVNTSSLINSLKYSRLQGALLDVWENEPDINFELLKKVFIATPHIAGYSTDGKANGTAMSINALSEFFDLPLKKWYPEEVPQPEKPEISIDGSLKTFEEIIREAVIHTYQITDDDNRLRKSPETFEQQRGNYPLRREFPAYNINLQNCAMEVLECLKNIGFQIKNK